MEMSCDNEDRLLLFFFIMSPFSPLDSLPCDKGQFTFPHNDISIILHCLGQSEI